MAMLRRNAFSKARPEDTSTAMQAEDERKALQYRITGFGVS
jgi:hypothetical protein